ncbi:MAG: mechanosensitive ion channel [Phycisphaerales bacterium]|nr:mechanosensitive ion channel [Phycisphaerales bacterium]
MIQADPIESPSQALSQAPSETPYVEVPADQAGQVPDGMTPQQGPSRFDELMDLVIRIWDTEIFRINETPIVVSKLTLSLLFFVIGLILAKLISRRVENTILPRFKVDPGPASAIQTILYYLMLTIAAVLALQFAGVPLTVFTIFGGALALGIGFGSQNVVNNFISGLILLIERPIQVNDLVTVQDETGTVVKIGARATQIHSYAGTTFIVPNSKLLENSVINWNLPTKKLRVIIRVGVAYGSDTALVKSLLEELLNDHIRVLESTENRVLFTDFGDSSLNFEVHFWIIPRTVLDRRQIESDLRFKIDQLFRENNITIPFPQRDLNFNPSSPISVEIKNQG